MKIEKAIQILKDHNKWRRARPPYDAIPPVECGITPKELGEAIDCVVNFTPAALGLLHSASYNADSRKETFFSVQNEAEWLKQYNALMEEYDD